MLFYRIQALVSSFNEAWAVCFEAKKENGITIYSKELKATFQAILDMTEDCPKLKQEIQRNKMFHEFFYNDNSFLGFATPIIQIKDGKATIALKEESDEFLRQLYILLSEVRDYVGEQISNLMFMSAVYDSYLNDLSIILNDSDFKTRRKLLSALYKDKSKRVSDRKEKKTLKHLSKWTKKYSISKIHHLATQERIGIRKDRIPELDRNIDFYTRIHTCLKDCEKAIVSVVTAETFFLDDLLGDILKENLLEME